MKKNVAILGSLVGILGLATGGMFLTGEKHLITVEENITLSTDNKKLRCANDSLVKENTSLTDKNKSLTIKMLNLSDSVSMISNSKAQESIKVLRNAEFEIALFSLEKIVKEELTWISPEAAYQALSEKLPRIPTKEEFKETLEDMVSKNLLYHYIPPDPYMKGEKVTKKEINKIIKNIIK